MLYQVTFTALYTEAGEEPKQVKKVAYVEAESTTEATANLIKVLSDTRKDLNYTGVVVSAISASPVKEVHFDKSKDDIFFKLRVGFKDDTTKKFKYTHWIIQADNLLNATAKAAEIAKDAESESELYSATLTENMVVPELVGDYSVSE